MSQPASVDEEGTAQASSNLLDTDRANQLFPRLGEDGVRDELIILYRPLAEYLARRFRGRGEPLDDLVQVALVALIKALDRFDLGREVKFSTYATATIVGELKRHFRDKGWALRVPRKLQESGLLVSKTVSHLSQDLGRSPTVKEIAKETGLTEEEVLEAMDTVHAYSAVSLDGPGPDDHTTSLQNIGAEDPNLELMENWASLSPSISQLPEREQRILYLRFFRGLTQTQIAEQLQMSQMHVSRLLSKTLRTLRSAMAETN